MNDCLGIGLFSDFYAPAMNFYGPDAFKAIYESEKAQREWAQIVRDRKPELIDEAYWQITQ